MKKMSSKFNRFVNLSESILRGLYYNKIFPYNFQKLIKRYITPQPLPLSFNFLHKNEEAEDGFQID